MQGREPCNMRTPRAGLKRRVVQLWPSRAIHSSLNPDCAEVMARAPRQMSQKDVTMASRCHGRVSSPEPAFFFSRFPALSCRSQLSASERTELDKALHEQDLTSLGPGVRPCR
jgi:hypothetical protein